MPNYLVQEIANPNGRPLGFNKLREICKTVFDYIQATTSSSSSYLADASGDHLRVEFRTKEGAAYHGLIINALHDKFFFRSCAFGSQYRFPPLMSRSGNRVEIKDVYIQVVRRSAMSQHFQENVCPPSNSTSVSATSMTTASANGSQNQSAGGKNTMEEKAKMMQTATILRNEQKGGEKISSQISPKRSDDDDDDDVQHSDCRSNESTTPSLGALTFQARKKKKNAEGAVIGEEEEKRRKKRLREWNMEVGMGSSDEGEKSPSSSTTQPQGQPSSSVEISTAVPQQGPHFSEEHHPTAALLRRTTRHVSNPSCSSSYQKRVTPSDGRKNCGGRHLSANIPATHNSHHQALVTAGGSGRPYQQHFNCDDNRNEHEEAEEEEELALCLRSRTLTLKQRQDQLASQVSDLNALSTNWNLLQEQIQKAMKEVLSEKMMTSPFSSSQKEMKKHYLLSSKKEKMLGAASSSSLFMSTTQHHALSTLEAQCIGLYLCYGDVLKRKESPYYEEFRLKGLQQVQHFRQSLCEELEKWKEGGNLLDSRHHYSSYHNHSEEQLANIFLQQLDCVEKALNGQLKIDSFPKLPKMEKMTAITSSSKAMPSRRHKNRQQKRSEEEEEEGKEQISKNIQHLVNTQAQYLQHQDRLMENPERAVDFLEHQIRYPAFGLALQYLVRVGVWEEIRLEYEELSQPHVRHHYNVPPSLMIVSSSPDSVASQRNASRQRELVDLAMTAMKHNLPKDVIENMLIR